MNIMRKAPAFYTTNVGVQKLDKDRIIVDFFTVMGIDTENGDAVEEVVSSMILDEDNGRYLLSQLQEHFGEKNTKKEKI